MVKEIPTNQTKEEETVVMVVVVFTQPMLLEEAIFLSVQGDQELEGVVVTNQEMMVAIQLFITLQLKVAQVEEVVTTTNQEVLVLHQAQNLT